MNPLARRIGRLEQKTGLGFEPTRWEVEFVEKLEDGSIVEEVGLIIFDGVRATRREGESEEDFRARFEAAYQSHLDTKGMPANTPRP